MSNWQLTELERAIGASGCIYVWIDRIALPQEESPLQRTLLARSAPQCPARPPAPSLCLGPPTS